jgi:hypothetical protein
LLAALSSTPEVSMMLVTPELCVDVAMYHGQGHGLAKVMGREIGVNTTGGCPWCARCSRLSS